MLMKVMDPKIVLGVGGIVPARLLRLAVVMVVMVMVMVVMVVMMVMVVASLVSSPGQVVTERVLGTPRSLPATKAMSFINIHHSRRPGSVTHCCHKTAPLASQMPAANA